MGFPRTRKDGLRDVTEVHVGRGGNPEKFAQEWTASKTVKYLDRSDPGESSADYGFPFH